MCDTKGTMATRAQKKDDLKVFISNKDSTCDECKESLGRRAWITLEREKGALCLSCADLDLLVFLPAGDATLTRRSKKHSSLWAVVLKWSRARQRYERQGLLVEEAALEQAEQECLADADARARKRERAAIRRAELDEEYVASFAKRVRELYPKCPPGREIEIAEHACLKHSNRIGRSAAAKRFDEAAMRVAIIAHIRHRETDYDELLGMGHDRWLARSQVEASVHELLARWRGDG